MKLAFGTKVDALFRKKLLHICHGFHWTADHASWLMAVMAFETAETFDPAITNFAGSGATGLIQFMPKTAKRLGTTTEELGKMSAVEQLDYVRLYYNDFHQRIHTLEDMYMAVLAPIAIGKPLSSPVFSSGAAYRMNSALDVDSDGVITKREACQFVRAKLEKGLGYGMWENAVWEHDATEILNLIGKIEDDVKDLRQLVISAGVLV